MTALDYPGLFAFIGVDCATVFGYNLRGEQAFGAIVFKAI